VGPGDGRAGRARQLPAAAATVPVPAHVLAHRPLERADRWPVVAVLLGAVLAVLGAVRWRRPSALELEAASDGDAPAVRAEPETARGTVLRVTAGLVLLLAATTATGLLPLGGATMGFGRGLALALVQVVAAVLLVRAGRPPQGIVGRPGRAPALGLVRPPRHPWSLALAPAVGIGLWIAGGVLLRVIPSTGEAPIESLVAWPSGTLAVGLAAVLVPVAEEVFFRGFVYGSLDRRFGTAVAFAVTVLLFAVAHVPQVWGAWGALASILLTGVALTGLRAWTGSTLVPVLAHLACNGVNVILSLASSVR